MKDTFLIITSIADDKHPVLKQYAKEALERDLDFIVVGDTKSPATFNINGCDFYSIEKQLNLNFNLVNDLPVKHYARKNLGYLVAISKGASVIIETDDDNLPFASFWDKRERKVNAHLLKDKSWVNVYKYFTDKHIWPRGFALENLLNENPKLENQSVVDCPIQQGLADENPDVDAIYRLTLPLPLTFNQSENIALGNNTICPFNSQNTTWFKEAFPLLYLPSYCSFRMTDIWRSFVAQRIAWTCDWSLLFHKSTVWQERNEHNLMVDFNDEISGYSNNLNLVESLQNLDLKDGQEFIGENMITCYQKLIDLKLIGEKEMPLLKSWLIDINKYF